MKLTQLDKNEALRYLGCRSELSDERITALLDLCEKQLLDLITPKYLYRVFDITSESEGVRISDSDIILTGNDAAQHLEGCGRIVLMCATIGQGADNLIRRLQVSDMAAAVITDSLASVAVEQVCDRAQEEILSTLSYNTHTWRFSPGYGDLPLDIQKALILLLDAPKKIGLCATDNQLLTPKKSVTAFIGLSDGEVSRKSRGCECCNMKDVCNFRKNGGHCGT